MTNREKRIEAEASALWRELYGDLPPASRDPAQILDLVLRRLPDMDYERLNSPHLRRAALTWPTRPGRV